MYLYRLNVNGDRYVVDTDDDLTEWKSSVADALQQGGGFINVTDAAGFRTTLLITSSSIVTMHKVEYQEPREEPSAQLLDEEAFTFEDY